MKRLCILLLVIGLVSCVPALADDVCRISGSALTNGVATDCSYISILCPVDAPAPVLVSIYAPDGSLAWQCDYGERNASLTTDDIYLKLQGSSTTYTAVVRVGSVNYEFPIVRQMARLRGNAACTAGYPLNEITGSDSWQSATILHVSAMEGQQLTVPVYASGKYVFGTATLTVQNGALTVSIETAANLDGSVDSAEIRVATDALTAQRIDGNRFSGIVGKPGKAIPLSGAEYAAVYVNLSVSFDPATASSGIQTQPAADQVSLWEAMQEATASESVG